MGIVWETYRKNKIGGICARWGGGAGAVFLLKLEPCSKVTIMITNTNGNVEVNFYGFNLDKVGHINITNLFNY